MWRRRVSAAQTPKPALRDRPGSSPAAAAVGQVDGGHTGQFPGPGIRSGPVVRSVVRCKRPCSAPRSREKGAKPLICLAPCSLVAPCGALTGGPGSLTLLPESRMNAHFRRFGVSQLPGKLPGRVACYAGSLGASLRLHFPEPRTASRPLLGKYLFRWHCLPVSASLSVMALCRQPPRAHIASSVPRCDEAHVGLARACAYRAPPPRIPRAGAYCSASQPGRVDVTLLRPSAGSEYGHDHCLSPSTLFRWHHSTFGNVATSSARVVRDCSWLPRAESCVTNPTDASTRLTRANPVAQVASPKKATPS